MHPHSKTIGTSSKPTISIISSRMAYRPRFHGSFQTGSRLETENPLEEVWSLIALHGSADFLQKRVTPPPGQPIDPYIEYAGIRARQAVEFREAARQATLLTSPLSLYYSFLNLTRACLCLHSDMLPSTWHGLIFRSGTDLLSSRAELTRGTFTDYLDATGYPWSSGQVVALHEALARTVEIRRDYADIYGGTSLVVPIDVDAYRDAEVVLNIPKNIYDLSAASTNWSSELPSISGCCTLGSGENTLETTFKVSNVEDVDSFCSLRMQRDLLWREFAARWYLVRQTDPNLVFPRPAYYFVTLFILGSIVRYEPELILDTVDPNSLSGWLFGRVVQAAERFFPQLMLSWLMGHHLYFKTAS